MYDFWNSPPSVGHTFFLSASESLMNIRAQSQDDMPDDVKTFMVQTLADLPQGRVKRAKRYQRKQMQDQRKEEEIVGKVDVSRSFLLESRDLA
jgi:hypothetical protein